MIPKRPAVFLDRDGVINTKPPDHNYVKSPQELHLFPFAPQAIQLLNQTGLPLIIISNQGGIAKGLYTETQAWQIHHYLLQQLKKHQAHIDYFYYCPHHPQGTLPSYTKTCSCRKPAIGLLKRAEKILSINLEKSFFIGDSLKTDIPAGNAAGCTTIQVSTGSNSRAPQELNHLATPDHTTDNLLTAAQLIHQLLSQALP